MTKRSVVVEESNLSIAWGKAFLEVFKHNEVAPMVVVIKDLNCQQDIEVGSIRDTLDQALKDNGKQTCDTVANTIFPTRLWVPEDDRQKLYQRYKTILKRLRKHDGNRYGLYFERLIAHGCDRNFDQGVNQLEAILQKRDRSVRRRTGYYATVFDPRKDHSLQPLRGFPCLQHVSFDASALDGLAITGSYVTQYMFEKAYGNYLGLYNLGKFMAHEMDLPLDRVTIVANPATRGTVPKKYLRSLVSHVKDVINGLQSELNLS